MTPAAVPRPAPRVHLAHLDGLRGLTALYVVLFHVRTETCVGRLRVPALALFNGGHWAVDVFIVLSGYCLALPCVRTGAVLRGGALRFYGRRARRIWPPMAASVVLGAACALLLRHVGRPDIAPVTGKVLLVNLLLLQDVLASCNTLNSVLWSVAVEWKIYFLFPLLLWVQRRGGLPATLLAGAVLSGAAWALLLALFPHLNLKYACPWYVGLFVLGMSAAFVRPAPPNTPWGQSVRWGLTATLCAAALLGLQHSLAVPERTGGWYGPFLWLEDTVMGCAAAAFLLFLTGTGTAARAAVRVLSLRPLVWLGTFAYSLYLVHLPILALIVGSLKRVPFLRASPDATALVLVSVGVPATIAFSYGFFLLVERPFLNTRRGETLAETARDAALSPAP